MSNQFEHIEDALIDILRSNSGPQGLVECHRTVVCVHTTSDRLAQWGSSVVWEDPLQKEMATHSSILAWEIQ